MRIDADMNIDFKPFYKGNTEIKKKGVKIEYTPEQVSETVKCFQDMKYFLKNYVYIISLDKGKVLFDLYDFQEEMLSEFSDNRFTIATLSRQMGKTITVCAFLLYQAIFNNDYFIAILANNASKSREILGRLKMMYELLPWWLKPGVVEWNKGSVEFSNGSKIFAGPTTNSSIRGFSINCVVGDTEIVVQNDDGVVEKIQIRDLLNEEYKINKFDFRDNDLPTKQEKPINKYRITYEKLIKKALSEERYKDEGIFESHHIKPRSLGGTNQKDNLVLLTLREHFVAHKLLVRMYEGKERAKMAVALFMMSNTRGVRISSRLYEEGKIAFLQNIQKRDWFQEERDQMSATKKDWWEANKEQIMKQRYESDHYQKVSESLKLHIRTEEHTNKINKNPEKIRKTAEKHRGMKRSEKTREKQSIAKQKFIEENGTKSFGKGMIYIHHKETGEVKRVEKDFDLGIDWIRGFGRRK